ncbi:MAG: cell division protein ZapA [Niabella sp.]
MIPININIADRVYRIKISPEDESSVRNSIKIINDKITDFKNNFPGKDMQDYISMVLVWFATEAKNKNVPLHEEKHLLDKLSQIEKLMDDNP